MKKVNCTVYMVVCEGELVAGTEGPMVTDKKGEANTLLKTIEAGEGEDYRVAKVKCLEVVPKK